MVTVVTKTIGTASRDYSTLQAWEDAAPANLVTADQVWRGECYNDSAFTAPLTVSGSTVDSTRYKELTVASGQSFADHASKLTNALTYDQTKGAAVSGAFPYSRPIAVSEDYFRLSRLQIRNTATVGQGILGSNQNLLMQQCIVDCAGTLAGQFDGAASLAENCLFVLRKASQFSVVRIAGSTSLLNCTVVVPSDITAATNGVQRFYSSGATVTNVAAFGCTAALSSTTGITSTNCYTNASSPPTGWTNVAYDTSTGSGFENTTNGTHDYRIKSTSALKDAGTSTGAPSVDIVGTTRPQGGSYDVGVWEYSSGTTARTITASLAVAIQAAQLLNASASAAVQLSPSASPSFDAAVQAAQTAQAQLAAAVLQAKTATSGLQAAVQAAGSASTAADAAVQTSAAQTASLAAAAQNARAATASLDLATQAASQQLSSLAAYVQAGSSVTTSAAAAVQVGGAASASIDGAVQVPVASTFSLAAAVAQAKTAVAALEAAVQVAHSASSSLSAQVQAGTTTAAGLEAAVQAARIASSTCSAGVSVLQSSSAGLAAALAVYQAASAAFDAAVFARRLASPAMSAYIQIGGYVPTGSIAEAVYVPASMRVDVPPDGQIIYVE